MLRVKASQLPTVVNADGSAEYAIEEPFEGTLKFDGRSEWTGEELAWYEDKDEPTVVRELCPGEAKALARRLNLLVPRSAGIGSGYKPL